MNVEIREAIYKVALLAPLLDANNLFYGIAPDETALPHCVISIVTNPTFRDSGTIFEELYVQFSVYSDVLTDAEDIAGEITGEFDNKPFNLNTYLSSYKAIQCIREYRNEIKVDEKIWHLVLRYKIVLEGTPS